jgi:dGTPase
LRAGLFRIEELREVPFLEELLAEIDARYPTLDLSRRIHELTRRVITRFVEDVVAEGERRIAALAPQKADDIRQAGDTMVCFSKAMKEADASIKRFLYARMYRHPDVMRVRAQADDVLRDLFRRFKAEPNLMPEEWQADLPRDDEPRLARRVADYIAGMTDRYAILEHRRLFDVTPDLR